MQEAISLIKELQSKVEISERVLRKQLIDPEEQKIKEEKAKLLEIGKAWLNDNIKEHLLTKYITLKMKEN